jgi:outer membrane protein assembly factor BamB
MSTPIVQDGIVYNAIQQALSACRASNGQRLWSRAIDEDMLLTSPIVADGILVVGGYYHGLLAFRAQDGQPLWSRDLGSGVNASPLSTDGVIYAGSGGVVFAIDLLDGRLLWQHDAGSVAVVSPAATADGVLYVSGLTWDPDGVHDTVHALRAPDGKPMWSRLFRNPNPIGSVPPGLTVANGVLYVGSHSGQLHALRAADGRLLKTLTTEGRISGAPTVANGLVSVSTWEAEGTVYTFGL